MREKVIKCLEAIVFNHPLNLIIGLFFLTCGINETLKTMSHDFSLGVHHGMIVLGLDQTLKSLSMILKGLKENQETGNFAELSELD